VHDEKVRPPVLCFIPFLVTFSLTSPYKLVFHLSVPCPSTSTCPSSSPPLTAFSSAGSFNPFPLFTSPALFVVTVGPSTSTPFLHHRFPAIRPSDSFPPSTLTPPHHRRMLPLALSHKYPLCTSVCLLPFKVRSPTSLLCQWFALCPFNRTLALTYRLFIHDLPSQSFASLLIITLSLLPFTVVTCSQ